MDQYSFILGMITAFCECVAGGCKRLDLSPPLTHEVFIQVKEEAYDLIKKHGLLHYHEENLDLPEEERFEWIVIAAKIRKEGSSPARSLKPFFGVLSYRPEEAVSTGYDAYREYFGRK